MAQQGGIWDGGLEGNKGLSFLPFFDLLLVSPIAQTQLEARGQGSLVRSLGENIPGHRAGQGRVENGVGHLM